MIIQVHVPGKRQPFEWLQIYIIVYTKNSRTAMLEQKV